MELYQLKTFVTVAEEGHLTRAANRLHTSQPAISAHIKSLEEELGVPLFVRTPKGMKLTREGDVLRKQAEKALSTIADIQSHALSLKEEVSGTIKLGLHIDPQFLRIDALLSYMQNHHCKLDFHLLQRWSWLQPEALKKGEIDGGFVYGIPEQTEIEVVSLRQFNILVVAPIKWKNRLEGAGWEEIAKMPWIWTPPTCQFCKIASRAFEKRNLYPIRVTVADQEPVIKTLVASGVGLAIMIEDEALEAQRQGKVAIWSEIVDTIDLSFLYYRKRKKDPLITSLLDGIMETWGVSSEGCREDTVTHPNKNHQKY
jgi:DNA-binding transcriptional LysR family regulator